MQDLFICGNCQLSFNELAQFLLHKQNPCQPITSSIVSDSEKTTEDTTIIVEQTTALQTHAESITVHDALHGIIQDLAVLEPSNSEHSQTIPVIDSSSTSNTTQFYQLKPIDGEDGRTFQLVPQSPPATLNDEAMTDVVCEAGKVMFSVECSTAPGCEPDSGANASGCEADSSHSPVIMASMPIVRETATKYTPGTVLMASIPDVDESRKSKDLNEPPKRRRGRPKRGEEKKKPKVVETTKLVEEKLPPPEKGSDGRYHCPRCKLSFTRERHCISHKCSADSIYADISKKVVDELSDASDEVDDDQRDITVNIRELTTLAQVQKLQEERAANDKDSEAQAAMDECDQISLAEVLAPIWTDDDSVETRKLLEKKIYAELQIETKKRHGNIVFEDEDLTEEERIQFEESLNIDLTGIDHMFKEHVIEQEINENDAIIPTRKSMDLLVYSCNTCDKVFKTLSHMRHHSLIHTNLRPFKCPRCTYTTNAKGNLYTHIRKHIGQYFTCEKCPFKSVNRTHLQEHEATHTGQKTECPICLKKYSTHKSYINHLRRYHGDSPAGVELLKSNQARSSAGQAILHQCHVCNRKFKKKVDRDRHLFMHNINAGDKMFTCGLCEYTASRREYLERHLQKHRIIYQCSECFSKFLSSITLRQHLTDKHPEQNSDRLYKQSIEKSLYLPEPDGGIEHLQPGTIRDAETKGGDQLLIEFEQTMELGHVTEAEIHGLNDNVAEQITKHVSTSRTEENLNPISQHINSKNLDDFVEEANSEKENAPKSTSDPLVELLGVNELGSPESWEIISSMGYQVLSMEILDKIHESFGHKECETCGRFFYTQIDYEAHLRTHSSDRPFACDDCPFRTVTKECLRRHVERYHDAITFPCDQCDHVAMSKSQLWGHRLIHLNSAKEVECPGCNSMISRRLLSSHIAAEHPNIPREAVLKATGINLQMRGRLGRRTYKCPYCSRIFSHANSEFQKHIWMHEGVKPYKCDVCSYSSRSVYSLKSHMLRHSEVKPYKCEICGKAYKSRTAVRWHVRSHQFGLMFKCNKCPYQASQKSHLTRHMECHNVHKRYQCHLCDFSANTMAYIRVHYTRNHPGQAYKATILQEPLPLEPNTRAFKCMTCDFVFGNLHDIRRHMKMKHNISDKEIQFTNNEEVDGDSVLDDPDTPQTVSDGLGPAVKTERVLSTVQLDPAMDTSDGDNALVDEKTASAVTLLQQIIGMQQDVLNSNQPIQVCAPDGQTLIIQQNGDEFVVTTATEQTNDAAQQFVIEYSSQNEDLIFSPAVQGDLPIESISAGMAPIEGLTSDNEGVVPTCTEHLTSEEHVAPVEDLPHTETTLVSAPMECNDNDSPALSSQPMEIDENSSSNSKENESNLIGISSLHSDSTRVKVDVS